MGREIQLEGGEVSVLKAIGLGGTHATGEMLIEKMPELEVVELIDTLRGLMMQGFVLADKQSFYAKEDLERTTFHVNSGYSRDLREAIDPRQRKPTSRRRRRE